MNSVRIKSKVLSAEGKVKVIWQIENGKNKDDMCQEFGLICDANDLGGKKQNYQCTWSQGIKNKAISNAWTKLHIWGTASSGLNKRGVTMYQWAVLFSW